MKIVKRAFATANRKYITTNENGHLKVYRYEEECPEVWREEDLIGDKYVLSLVQRIEELEDEIQRYVEIEAEESI